MSDGKCYIGADVGGTKTRVMIVEERGIVLEKCFSTPRCVEGLLDAIGECMASQNGKEIGGIAMGLPGRVSRDGLKVIDAPSLGWQDVALAAMIEERFGCPCQLENDTSMALLAETKYGAAVGRKNAMLLTIGTGLGCAIFSDGQLLRGASGSAGEVGYCIFDENCADSGNRIGDFGTLEHTISGTFLSAQAARFGVTPDMLFRPEAPMEQRQTVERFCRLLAITIANLTSILDPGLILLGGGVSESMEYDCMEFLRVNVVRLTPISVQIEQAKFLNRAGAVGACICAWQVGQNHSTRDEKIACEV